MWVGGWVGGSAKIPGGQFDPPPPPLSVSKGLARWLVICHLWVDGGWDTKGIIGTCKAMVTVASHVRLTNLDALVGEYNGTTAGGEGMESGCAPCAEGHCISAFSGFM